MLSTCIWGGSEFTCELTILKGRIVVKSYEGKTSLTLDLSNVSKVSVEGNELIINTYDGGSLMISIKTGIMEYVHYIMQYIEFRDRRKEILEGLEEALILFSEVLTTGFRILKMLKRGGFPNWNIIESLGANLRSVVEDKFRTYFPSMKATQDLVNSIIRRNISGIRLNIKTTLRETALATKRRLSRLSNILNLQAFADIILLVYAYFIAKELGLVLEKDKILSTLSEYLQEFHSKVFTMDEESTRSLTNWTISIVRHSQAPEIVLKGYLRKFSDYLNAYYGSRVSSSTK